MLRKDVVMAGNRAHCFVTCQVLQIGILVLYSLVLVSYLWLFLIRKLLDDGLWQLWLCSENCFYYIGSVQECWQKTCTVLQVLWFVLDKGSQFHFKSDNLILDYGQVTLNHKHLTMTLCHWELFLWLSWCTFWRLSKKLIFLSILALRICSCSWLWVPNCAGAIVSATHG